MTTPMVTVYKMGDAHAADLNTNDDGHSGGWITWLWLGETDDEIIAELEEAGYTLILFECGCSWDDDPDVIRSE